MDAATTFQDLRLIFHVDVNSAFLSWSALKALREDPSGVDLRTIPSAIGGDVKLRKGVITARSIPAKKYGVKTGESVMAALQKCPHLVLVRSDFQTYRTYSKLLMELLGSYGGALEQVSIDEAFLDMTGSLKSLLEAGGGEDLSEGGAEALIVSAWAEIAALAERLKGEVREKLGFTVNVGISTNKLLAKMASDFEKPDKVHTLWPWEVPEKLWPLPVGDLYGCGHATAFRLLEMGVKTIGDAAKLEKEILRQNLGESTGAYIWEASRGIGSDQVSTVREDAKSYSNEWTMSVDVDASNYEAQALPLLRALSGSVSERLVRDGVYASTIGILVKTDAFVRRTRQVKLKESTNEEEAIYQAAQKLLFSFCFGDEDEEGLFCQGRSLRLIGVKADHLDRGEYRQITFFDYARSLEEEAQEKERAEREKEKRDRLREMMGKIRQRYGPEAVYLGNRKKEEAETEIKAKEGGKR